MYTLCTTEKTARQQQQFEQTFLQMMLERKTFFNKVMYTMD